MGIKQFTDEEQMQRLTPDAFEQLTEWMITNGHLDAQAWEPGDYDLSIGEMLEFLEEHPSKQFGKLSNTAMLQNGVLVPVEMMVDNLYMAVAGVLEYE